MSQNELKPSNNMIIIYNIIKNDIDLNIYNNNTDFIIQKVLNLNVHLKKQNKKKINMEKKNKKNYNWSSLL